MSRDWARTSADDTVWHYFPVGMPESFVREASSACDVVVNAACCEERADLPDREIPDPVCPTCWKCRQAVEAYRRTLKPDPRIASLFERLKTSLTSVAGDILSAAGDLDSLGRTAELIADQLANTEEP